MNEIKKSESTTHVFLSNRDYEAEIGFCKLLSSILRTFFNETTKTNLFVGIAFVEALGIFSRPHCSESLALVNPNNDLLLGVVNKTDLYLVLSEIMRREKLQ